MTPSGIELATTVPPRSPFMQELVIYKILHCVLSYMKGNELLLNCVRWFCLQPMLVTARPKACFCGRSLCENAVSNPAEGMMPVSCEWCVLSGRDLCDGPIPSPEESYPVPLCMYGVWSGTTMYGVWSGTTMYGVWSGTTIPSTPTMNKRKEVKTKKERKKDCGHIVLLSRMCQCVMPIHSSTPYILKIGHS